MHVALQQIFFHSFSLGHRVIEISPMELRMGIPPTNFINEVETPLTPETLATEPAELAKYRMEKVLKLQVLNTSN
jgi:hypothetical protein